MGFNSGFKGLNEIGKALNAACQGYLSACPKWHAER